MKNSVMPSSSLGRTVVCVHCCWFDVKLSHFLCITFCRQWSDAVRLHCQSWCPLEFCITVQYYICWCACQWSHSRW